MLNKNINVWILFSFSLTFGLFRLGNLFNPGTWMHVNNVSLHHFLYGIVIVCFAGLFALNNLHKKYPRLSGGIFGFGLGLIMDEFGMLTLFRNDYWTPLSYYAILMTILVLLFFTFKSRN